MDKMIVLSNGSAVNPAMIAAVTCDRKTVQIAAGQMVLKIHFDTDQEAKDARDEIIEQIEVARMSFKERLLYRAELDRQLAHVRAAKERLQTLKEGDES